MANIFKPKRSSVASKVPTTSDIVSGEIAVNSTDQKIYTNNGTSVVQIGSGRLAGLSDVSVSGINSGEFLSWNGSAFVANSSVATLSGTQTLTNKRISLRIGTASSGSNITIPGDSSDQFNVTALASGVSFLVPSGTPTDGQKLTIRIKDNGSSQSIAWTTTAGGFRVIGTTLPTNTPAGKVMYVGCIYNAQDGFWDVTAVAKQA